MAIRDEECKGIGGKDRSAGSSRLSIEIQWKFSGNSVEIQWKFNSAEFITR